MNSIGPISSITTQHQQHGAGASSRPSSTDQPNPQGGSSSTNPFPSSWPWVLPKNPAAIVVNRPPDELKSSGLS
ncbi:MAG: hypothetical protein ACON35_00305 [Candidatus Marinamargulisbacteria bacterium]